MKNIASRTLFSALIICRRLSCSLVIGFAEAAMKRTARKGKINPAIFEVVLDIFPLLQLHY
jgi:hypothetical protein